MPSEHRRVVIMIYIFPSFDYQYGSSRGSRAHWVFNTELILTDDATNLDFLLSDTSPLLSPLLPNFFLHHSCGILIFTRRPYTTV
jgi:hypothetical protein